MRGLLLLDSFIFTSTKDGRLKLAIEEQLLRITSAISPASEIQTTGQQKERDGPFFDQIAVFVVPPVDDRPAFTHGEYSAASANGTK